MPYFKSISKKGAGMKKLFCLSVLFVLCLSVVVSCGGGSDSSPSPVVNENPEGIWTGTFTESGMGTYVVDMLVYNGEIIGLSTDASAIFVGTYTVSGNSITADVKAYAIGGGPYATSVITGTFSEQSQFDATFSSTYISSGTTSTGSITLTYDSIYDRSSSLAMLEGTWSETDGAYTITADVDAFGSLSGTDTAGCGYSGVISILDPNKNLYGIDIDVSTCSSFNGSYDGFAVLTDTTTQNDTFVYTVSNDYYVIMGVMTKQ